MKELLGLPPSKKGKVRDIYYCLDEETQKPTIMMLATDRISAFDVVLPDEIPDKGKVLNQISLFWYKKLKHIVDNHLISTNPFKYPEVFWPYADLLTGRSMLIKKAEPLPVECIVRGYISGSGWSAYKKEGSICCIELPKGLKESEKLPEPLYTPSTKAFAGEHDINISYKETIPLVGKDVAEKIRDISLQIYKLGAEYALKKGIIIADTKFEFGILDGEIILIDEVLTPDSSRFWSLSDYEPGCAQNSFDKQGVRDWLTASGWNKKPPGPSLHPRLIWNTSSVYREIYNRLTGETI
jgi:phosphoribosylaminoimidazole-succinocarboxamide synthase